MQNSKLVRILKKFSQEEITSLKQFMGTPYFVKRVSLRDFAFAILNEYPKFDSRVLDEEVLYKVLYPGQEFQSKTILRLMTEMIANVNEFLVLENFLKDKEDHGPRLMEELRKKNLGFELKSMATKIADKIESGKKDQQHFYQLMRFENELGIYYNQSKEHEGYSQHLQNRANALDTFYISTKLRIVCEMFNRQNIFSVEYEISILDAILEYVERNIQKSENQSSVNIYYRILFTLTNPSDEENYFKLIDLLDKAENDFSSEELKEMYTFAMNYCIKQLNNGRVEYESHLFRLYCKLIETGLIYENNYISQWDFKNIIATSLRLSEMEWTEDFINSNKDKITPAFKDVSYHFNLANLYYEKGEFVSAVKTLHQFDDALKKVSDPDFDDTFYNLDSRSMFIKIYYESKEDDTLRATIETFRSYLVRNKKISDSRRKNYLNLLKYTKKLSDQRQRLMYRSNKRTTKVNINKLKNEINSDKKIINLSWLQARVEELEKEVG